ncbi:hypothetical protein K438DRAFT_1876826 [Mycena galopus ATCC 62051]|nr:hypothetical protein K438DRAFT_1876826 [Mycena galopus ATCC 62051]
MDATRSCPILAMPLDIITQIFTHCLPHLISAPRIDTAPLLLGRICGSWRNIALNSPGLWTALKIDRGDIPVALSETWLSRAKSMPLSLELNVLHLNHWDCSAMIVLFKQHSRTWRDISLHVPVEQMYLLDTDDLPLPLLERLVIRTLPKTEPAYNAFRNAPALRQLSLLGPLADMTVLQLPWTQLTTLECRSGVLTPAEFLTVLQYTPNIVHCAVTSHYASKDALPDVLDLSHIYCFGRDFVPRLHPFLSRPDCQLQKFDLIQGSFDLVTAICRRLCDGGPFLPRLVSLVFSPNINHVSETTFPAMLDALGDALSTRWIAPSESFARIRECSVSWSGRRATDDLKLQLDNAVAAFRPRQQELVALGMNLSLIMSTEF